VMFPHEMFESHKKERANEAVPEPSSDGAVDLAQDETAGSCPLPSSLLTSQVWGDMPTAPGSWGSCLGPWA
jgi:hypothetical protein